MDKSSKKLRLRLTVAAGLVGMAAAAVIADDLYVQRDVLELTNQPSPLADVVEAVKRNAKVTVVQPPQDNWVKIQTASGKQGYASTDALGPTLASGTAVAENSGQNANAPAALDMTLAGKGALEPDAQNYSRDKNYNQEPLNRLIALNQTSDDMARQWIQFCKDAKVGDYKPR